MNDKPITIGEREGWGDPQPFGISAVDQRQHIYMIGKTGSGKTTLLRNLILQHIALGHGVGGSVRKGEKSCPVVFWKPMKIADKESGEEKKIPFLRIYHVFNVAQCDSLKDAAPVTDANVATVKPAEIVAQMPQPPVIKHGMTCAFYAPHDDCVGMPSRERFETEDGFFATLYHELVHSTGHAKRLKRTTLAEHNGFGSDPYCKEELIAEMGAAFLCGHAEIIERTIDSSAAYIHGWLERIRKDNTLIVQAAAQAQKAADFILGRTTIESTEVVA